MTMYAPAAQTVHHVVRPQVSLRHDLKAGAIAGQIAGLAMAVALIAEYWLRLGTHPLFPVQVIGSLVTGEQALRGVHLPSIAVGVLLHQLGPALAWGLVFGILAHVFRIRNPVVVLVLGLAVGALSQIVDVRILVPQAFYAIQGHDIWRENVPMRVSWDAHLIYGFVLGLYPMSPMRWRSRTRVDRTVEWVNED